MGRGPPDRSLRSEQKSDGVCMGGKNNDNGRAEKKGGNVLELRELCWYTIIDNLGKLVMIQIMEHNKLREKIQLTSHSL